MEFKRARTEEQKDQRLKQILQAAEDLLQKYDYAEINMKLIAEQLDYTRANLYKYYGSKEEIYSALFQRQLHTWIEETLRCFAAAGYGSGAYTADAGGQAKTAVRGTLCNNPAAPLNDAKFAALWSEIMGRYGIMLKIDSLLSAIIENHISFEKLIEFKSTIMNDFYRLLPLIRQQVPFFTEGEAKDFLYFQLLHASALYMNVQARHREQKLLKICDPDYNFIEFVPTFQSYLHTQLSGLRARKG